jgi:hypothetical protein
MTGKRLVGKFALGATLGVALTLTATQAWNATAAPGDSDTTYVPVTPCRLLDTRPGTLPASGKKTPLGPGVANIHTQQVTGNVGSCVGIPATATAVAMNVTAANATASSFLTVYPADKALPNASNLNWVAGQAPIPNKVDVRLSADGKIKMYTESGTVNVIADVVGYYTPTSLVEIDDRLAALEAKVGADRSVVEYAAAIDEVDIELATVSPELIVAPASKHLTVTINAPRAGKIAVVANATAKKTFGSGTTGRLVCQITDDPAATGIDAGLDGDVLGIAAPVGTDGAQPSLGTNRVFDVAAGPHTYDLICAATDEPVTIHYRSMSATFTPNG